MATLLHFSANFLLQLILFFVAGYVQFLYVFDKRWPPAGIVWLALPIATVYFLGWWSLGTWLVGTIAGGRVFSEWASKQRGEDLPK